MATHAMAKYRHTLEILHVLISLSWEKQMPELTMGRPAISNTCGISNWMCVRML